MKNYVSQCREWPPIRQTIKFTAADQKSGSFFCLFELAHALKRKDNSKNATLVGNIGNIILVSCFIFFEKVARVSSKWLEMCGCVRTKF